MRFINNRTCSKREYYEIATKLSVRASSEHFDWKEKAFAESKKRTFSSFRLFFSPLSPRATKEELSSSSRGIYDNNNNFDE